MDYLKYNYFSKHLFFLICLQLPVLFAKEVQTKSIQIGHKTYTVDSNEQDNYLSSRGGVFEKEMCGLFSTFCNKKDSIVLDVGANIGLTTLLFGDIAHKVYAFEPVLSTFHFLKTNIDRAKKNNIELHNIGLGDIAQNATIKQCDTFPAGAFISDFVQADSKIGLEDEAITINTIDTFVKESSIEKVSMIKIDAEGFEEKILAGAEKTLKKMKPVVILEMNVFCLNVFQRRSLPDFLDTLRSFFPIILAYDESKSYNLHDPNEAYHVMHQHITNFKFANLICAFEENQLSNFREAVYVEYPKLKLEPISIKELSSLDRELVLAHANKQKSNNSCQWDIPRQLVVLKKDKKFRVYKVGAGRQPALFSSKNYEEIKKFLNEYKYGL